MGGLSVTCMMDRSLDLCCSAYCYNSILCFRPIELVFYTFFVLSTANICCLSAFCLLPIRHRIHTNPLGPSEHVIIVRINVSEPSACSSVCVSKTMWLVFFVDLCTIKSVNTGCNIVRQIQLDSCTFKTYQHWYLCKKLYLQTCTQSSHDNPAYLILSPLLILFQPHWFKIGRAHV